MSLAVICACFFVSAVLCLSLDYASYSKSPIASGTVIFTLNHGTALLKIFIFRIYILWTTFEVFLYICTYTHKHTQFTPSFPYYIVWVCFSQSMNKYCKLLLIKVHTLFVLSKFYPLAFFCSRILCKHYI